MRWMIVLLGLVLPVLAVAGAQKDFDVDEGPRAWTFHYRYAGADGKVRKLDFELPATALADDKGEPTWFPRKKMNEAVALEVRKWGKTVGDGVNLRARVDKGAVRIEASGPKGPTKKALKQAEDVRDAAQAAWLDDNGFVALDDGLSFDHARLARDYAPQLAPVAAALKDGAGSERAFVDEALAFVQAIPYEARKRNGRDPGYRRPLALLARNRGDCDSKAVLFLGLVRAAYPELELAVVYVPGHALAAVGLPKEKGDQVVKVEGSKLLLAEPVGPSRLPVGQAAPGNKGRARRGEARAVPG